MFSTLIGSAVRGCTLWVRVLAPSFFAVVMFAVTGCLPDESSKFTTFPFDPSEFADTFGDTASAVDDDDGDDDDDASGDDDDASGDDDDVTSDDDDASGDDDDDDDSTDDDDDATTVPEPETQSFTVPEDATEDAVFEFNGVKVTFAAGLLAPGTSVAITSNAVSSASVPEDFVAASPVYEIVVEDKAVSTDTLTGPLEVAIEVDGKKVLRPRLFRQGASSLAGWEQAPTFEFKRGKLTGRSLKLGYYVALKHKREGETVKRRYTYKGMGGVSMGSGASFMIGIRHHEKFDFITGNGGIGDFMYLWDLVMNQFMAGFCALDEIDPENPNKDCGPIPARQQFERPNHFNEWFFACNGGCFDRDSYIEIFQDICFGFGNAFFYNPESPYLPPGVSREYFEKSPSEQCAEPVVLKNFYNAEWNPTGSFDVITFCDGDGREQDYEQGVFNPDAPHEVPMIIGLTVDFNGNGKRDVGEPVLRNNQERFQDVGCSPEEEKYDYMTNPLGKKLNWVRDECEPFDDFGLDGVANTNDYGEGNGKYDYGPTFVNWMAHTPRTYLIPYYAELARAAYEQLKANDEEDGGDSASRVNLGDTELRPMTAEEIARLDFFGDAGIRDMINFATNTNQLFGGIKAVVPDTKIYDHFTADLESQPPNAEWGVPEYALVPFTREIKYAYDLVDWTFKGKNAYVRYGNWGADEEAIEEGDGAHVGTTAQAVFRFNTTYNFVSARWPNGDWSDVREVTGEKTINFGSLVKRVMYPSEALGVERPAVVLLPPGYDHPAYKDVRYPVFYYHHGYGMDSEGLSATAAIYLTLMNNGSLQKYIIVYTEGSCCFRNTETDALDCGRERPSGPWVRECNRGSFYADQLGVSGDDGRAYESSIIDLMDYVDANFRTKAPEDVDVPADLGTMPDQRVLNLKTR